MSCNRSLFLALLLVQRDAEFLLVDCYGFKKGEIDIDEFTSAVEEVAGKLLQRARETTQSEEDTLFPTVTKEKLDEIDIPF